MNHEGLARALSRNGVDCVFGVPGTQVVSLLEALRAARIRFVLAAHESGAAFMANGYARASGRPGVVLTIGGPGFTNALTGVAEASRDSAALLLITSAPGGGPEGDRFSLQALNQRGIAGSLVKAALRIGGADDPARVIDAAVARTMDGEPGPVLLEVDSWASRRDPGNADPTPFTGTPDPEPARSGGASLDAVAHRWREARRPLLYLGQGAARAAHAVGELVERVRVPVLTTPSGRGILDETHELAMGFDPLRGGVAEANRLLEEADLVLVLGAKLSHNGTAGFALRFPERTTVHVDRDGTIPGARYPCSLAVQATAEVTLTRLLADDMPSAPSAWPRERLADARRSLSTPKEDPTEPTLGTPGRPAIGAFFDWLHRALPAEAILVTDSGQHQVMTRRHLQVRRPLGLLLPSDLQSMGFGLPAAVGALTSGTGRPVAALVGDGGFLMAGMELTTAVREGLPLPVIVFSDGYLNQIRLQQLRGSGHAAGVRLGGLSLEAFAYAVGADYRRFDGDTRSELLRQVFAGSRPTIVEVPIGDSPHLPRIENRARLKTLARRVVGPGRVSRIKRWLGLG